jgi:hypothetical protein
MTIADRFAIWMLAEFFLALGAIALMAVLQIPWIGPISIGLFSLAVLVTLLRFLR